MKGSRLRGLVAVVCFFSATSAAAQEAAPTSVVPRLVRFSGTVTDISGKAASGPVTIVFSLYAEQQGGTPLWTETQQATADPGGHYTVLLGSTQPDGLPLDLFTTGRARWLGVQPAVEGVGEQPRILLVGVPYALKAADAETLGGKPVSAYLLSHPEEPASEKAAGSKAAEPTGQTSEKVPTANDTQVQKVATGSKNFVAKFTDTKNDLGNSEIFDTGSGVGIGTTSPAAKLDVNGAANFRSTAAFGGLITFAKGQTFPGTGTVTRVGSGAGLTGGAVTTSGTLSIATGGVTNAMLVNSSLTVKAGSGLSGGGAVSLGGSTTLTLSPAVSGTTGTFSGRTSPAVSGTDTANSAVGQLGTSVNGTATGVYGNGSAYGVYGSSSGYGVAGVGSTYGVVGNSSATGVYGSTSDGDYGELGARVGGNTYGVYGSSGNVGVYGSGTYGVYGSSSGYGVAGVGSTYGVVGNSSGTGVYGSGTGVYGANTSNSSYGQLGASVGGNAYGLYGQGSSYGVYSAGNFAVESGFTKSGMAVLRDDSAVLLYSVESPENWYEDFGSGQLRDGVTTVELEPTFAETVNPEVGYHVFVTPNDECEGLYVTQKTATSFEVRELHNGNSNVTFDYRIVAKQKGLESLRLEGVSTNHDAAERMRKQLAERPSHTPKLPLRKPPEAPTQPPKLPPLPASQGR